MTCRCFFRTVFRAGMNPIMDLPLAVGTAATRFFPVRALGMASAWGGYISMNPWASKASLRLSGISRSLNFINPVKGYGLISLSRKIPI